MTVNASTTTFNTTSDLRLKENISNSVNGLDILNQIKIVDYNYINDPEHQLHTGVIAQDLNEIFPTAVKAPADESEYWMVDYSKLVAPAIRAIQEQQTQIDELREMVQDSGGWIQDNNIAGTVSIREEVINGDLKVEGKIYSGSDTTGRVTIVSGETEIEIKFEEPYKTVPNVVITPIGLDSITFSLKYDVDEITTDSFKLNLIRH